MKKTAIILIILVLGSFLKISANTDSLKIVSDSLSNSLKIYISDSTRKDSADVNKILELLDNSNTANNNLLEAYKTELNKYKNTISNKSSEDKEKVAGILVFDNLHIYVYLGFGVIFILFFIFLFSYFSAKKKYNRTNEELYDIEDILEKYNKKNIEASKKLEALFKEYSQLKSLSSSNESEKQNVEENLSFMKVENTKLIEKIEDLEKQLVEKEHADTETINKLLELNKEIEALQDELASKTKKIDELNNQVSDASSFSSIPPNKQKELQEIDFNIAKLEKISKLKSSGTITNEEFDELKKKIIKTF